MAYQSFADNVAPDVYDEQVEDKKSISYLLGIQIQPCSWSILRREDHFRTLHQTVIPSLRICDLLRSSGVSFLKLYSRIYRPDTWSPRIRTTYGADG